MAVAKAYIMTEMKTKMRTDKTTFFTLSAITTESVLVYGSTKDTEMFKYLERGEFMVIMGCRSSPRLDGSLFVELLPETKVTSSFLSRH